MAHPLSVINNPTTMIDIGHVPLEISVVIPMYNAAPYLRACIDSVLSQSFENFELIIVDDGSTDDSVRIVESYNDSRVRLIKNEHDFIGTCNTYLKEAVGKYLVRMDADDVMPKDRLERQYLYMESHPDVDVMGGCMEYINGDKEDNMIGEAISCTIDGMLKDNMIANSTTIARREFIEKHHIRFEHKYVYAEDYGFWMSMLLHGANIMIEPQLLVSYRYSDTQTTKVHYREMLEATERVKEDARAIISQRLNNGYVNPAIKPTDNKLTVIIPFLNEGEEVGRTVCSIRETVGNKVDIIVINDCSTDGYPYQKDLLPLNVYYIVNSKRQGVAASRDMGIGLSKTPYFLLLDGHMRFYDSQWCEYIVNLLTENDRRLLCTQGRYLEKVDGVVREIASRTYKSYGAYMPLIKGHTLTEIVWKGNEYAPEADTEPIPVVLGAGYAASKRYWNHLRGLEGLRYYGNDEAYISMKVWMEGGECVLLKKVVVGHIYRKKSPYKRYSADELFNELLISYLLFPQSLWCVEFATLCKTNRDLFLMALEKFQEESKRWVALREYYRRSFTKTFRDFTEVQQRLCSQFLEEFKKKDIDVKSIAQFVSEKPLEEKGLFDGTMGQILWLCIYENSSEDHTYKDHIKALWDGVAVAVHHKKFPCNFSNGLAGIGWGLIFLKEHNMIEDDISEELNLIDRQLSCYAIQKDKDLSLATGSGGILAYATARKMYGIKNHIPAEWIDDNEEILMKAAQMVIDESSELNALVYAMRYIALCREGYDEQDYPINLGDWMDVKDFIPKNPRRWTSVLTDTTLTTSTLYLIYHKKLNRHGKIQ